jgi:hypothetical protein
MNIRTKACFLEILLAMLKWFEIFPRIRLSALKLLLLNLIRLSQKSNHHQDENRNVAVLNRDQVLQISAPV